MDLLGKILGRPVQFIAMQCPRDMLLLMEAIRSYKARRESLVEGLPRSYCRASRGRTYWPAWKTHGRRMEDAIESSDMSTDHEEARESEEV